MFVPSLFRAATVKLIISAMLQYSFSSLFAFLVGG
jgi:hypothetical protein